MKRFWLNNLNYTFFVVRTSQILMMLNVLVFFEGFQPYIILIFSMKHSYRLMTKITPGVSLKEYFIIGWFTAGREYFNATLGKCRVVTQPDRISLIRSQKRL